MVDVLAAGGERPNLEPAHGRAKCRPIAVDLFAGAGGLSLGLEQAGFDVVAAVEYDPIHCAVHAVNFPRTEVLCADVGGVTRRELRLAVRSGLQQHGQVLNTWDGQIDVIAGGPPCQGFSTIGKSLIDDKRNRLVFEFFRVVSEMRPRYFLMENVPGMISGGHKTAILDRLMEEFKAIGYSMSEPPRVLNAALFGVPQDRRRLFLLGSREDLKTPDYPWPTVEPRLKRSGSRPLIAQITLGRLASGPTVWDALGDLPDADDFPELFASDEVALAPGTVAEQTVRSSGYARRLRGLESDPGDYSHPRAWDPAFLTSSMRTTHTDLSARRFAATEPGAIEPVSRFYRLTSDGLCNTIRAGTASDHGAFTAPRPIHPTLPRVLTVREAARLHSFPDWFRFHRTKWHGFRQVGNAVPPLLGRAVGAQIIEALGVLPLRPIMPWELGPVQLLGLDNGEASEFFEAPKVPGVSRQRRSSKVDVA